jgi:hypothetical protein
LTPRPGASRTGRSHKGLGRGSWLVAAASVMVAALCVSAQRADASQFQPATSCPNSATTVPMPGGGNLTIRCKWEQFLGGHVEQSSPEIATLDQDGPSIVVGTRDTGQVYALHLSDGSAVPGWPADTGSAVDSSPTAVPSPTGDGLDDVVVDAGDVVTVPPVSLDVDHGSVEELAPDGSTVFKRGLADQFDRTFGPDRRRMAEKDGRQHVLHCGDLGPLRRNRSDHRGR